MRDDKMGVGGAFSAFGRGVSLLFSTPSLWPLAALPAIMAMMASFLGFYLASHYGVEIFNLIWAEPENFILHFFWAIFAFFFKVASVLLTLFITPWLVMLLGLPLCEPLAAKVDELLGGKPVEGSFWGDIAKTLLTTGAIAIIGLTGTVFFFALGLIPLLGIVVGPFVYFVWTPAFLGFDLFDSGLARRQFSFRQKLDLVMANKLMTITVGLIGVACFSIPVVNLVGLPVAVITGVVAVRQLEEAGQLGPITDA
jgi:CysZ protein